MSLWLAGEGIGFASLHRVAGVARAVEPEAGRACGTSYKCLLKRVRPPLRPFH